MASSKTVTSAGIQKTPTKDDVFQRQQAEIQDLKTNFDGQCKVIGEKGEKRTVKLHPEGLDIVFNFVIPVVYPEKPPLIVVHSESLTDDHKYELSEFLQAEAENSGDTISMASQVELGLMWLKEGGISVKGSKKHGNKKGAAPLTGKAKRKQRKKKLEEQDSAQIQDKKASMKTAIDVIKRILWDSELPRDEFLVGYVDRFKGLMEKYFTAFSWEDIASVDYTVLAIPKHRIQYFKYKDEKVWDKVQRLDNVFGSTGSKITIADVISRHEAQSGAASGKPSIETGQVDENDDDIGALRDGYNADSNNYWSGDESDSSDDGIEVTIDGQSGFSRLGECSVSEDDDDENDESGDKYWRDKMRPNYFLALRVTDKDILNTVADVQDVILENEPKFFQCCIPPVSLHITLCTVGLDTPEQVQNAVKCLQEAKEEFAGIIPKGKGIHVKGVDNFFNRVVYGKVQYPPEFIEFVDHLKLCLTERGIEIRDTHDFVPHMTIMKISRPVGRATGKKYVAPWLYSGFSDTDFGDQEVNNVHLCEMGDSRQEDGFYITATSVTF